MTMIEALNVNSDNDLILKPISGLRGKRHKSIPAGQLYAVVWLNENSQSDWCHPELELGVYYTCKTSTTVYDERKTLLSIRYQRTDRTKDKYSKSQGTPPAPSIGFMRGNAPKGQWSRSYAMKITSESQWGNNINKFEAAVGLIQRAFDAVSYDKSPKIYRILSKIDDDLLTLIAGLQRIGVTIVIKNGRKARLNMFSEV
jgi:hypothetical protein